jgi:uncharacterized membrane protein YidH (DUF202 family)
MSECDPGLQPERTALAWQRTGLAAVVLGVLLLRHGLAVGAPLEIIAGVFAAAVVLFSGLPMRAVRSSGSSRIRLILVTLAVVAAGACTTALRAGSG